MGGDPQDSLLGPLLFLININGLPSGLKTNAKLFADDTSIFTIVNDENETANALNNDLSLNAKWAFNWKMIFNPDPHQPAQEVLFSRKKKVSVHPVISLKVSYQKHLGLFLDENWLLNILLTIRFARSINV